MLFKRSSSAVLSGRQARQMADRAHFDDVVSRSLHKKVRFAT